MIRRNVLIIKAAFLLFISLLVTACGGDNNSSNFERSYKPWVLSQNTDQQVFAVKFSCKEKPFVGDFQQCYLGLKRSNQTVSDANISIDGGMKAHGHGLPTSPEVIATDTPGKYKIEGLKFSMPGEWIVGFKIDLDNPALTDQVIFKLSI